MSSGRMRLGRTRCYRTLAAAVSSADGAVLTAQNPRKVHRDCGSGSQAQHLASDFGTNILRDPASLSVRFVPRFRSAVLSRCCVRMAVCRSYVPS